MTSIIRYIFASGIVVFIGHYAHAQEPVCAHDAELSPHGTAAPLNLNVPMIGSFAGLMVFVRFRDDVIEGSCAPRGFQWTVSDTLPTFAPEMADPLSEKSLDYFFSQQSQGQFDFQVSHYDNVIVTEEDELAYATGPGSGILSQTKLTEEVLDHLDNDPDFDFTNYDLNLDGWLDHIFIIPRRLDTLALVNLSKASGVSNLGFGHTTSTTRFDGIKISNRFSGSYNHYGTAGNILPLQDFTRLMAHEFGHDLWNFQSRGFPNHLNPVQGNLVPYDPNEPDEADETAGYILMAGVGARRAVTADNIISAYERSLSGLDYVPGNYNRDDRRVERRLYI